MQYLGGKSRLAKRFAPILEAALATREGRYVEPFVGGFNIAPALRGIRSALFADAHPGLIALYNALQQGWDPPEELPEWLYRCIRIAPDWSHPMSAVAAFGCSFGGKEWGGYARAPKHPERSYARHARNSLRRKFPVAFPAAFLCARYWELPPTAPAVYYLDPPYRNTTGYKVGAFDSARFDRWAESLIASGHVAFVSEFEAPAHWPVVWEFERAMSCSLKQGPVKVDRLYRVVPA